jgi:N-acetylglucosamine-6-phosphate deacetylase
MTRTILRGAMVFDGVRFHEATSVVLCGDRIDALVPEGDAPVGTVLDLTGCTLAPGFVDLQVNGGGGRMLDAATDVAAIRTICAAHARLGATSILPTLITTTVAGMDRAIEAAVAAVGLVPGCLGLHLEGPHLDPVRCGAHDPRLIRPMGPADLERLLDAARRLPVLMVTVAPESVSVAQITALSEAGVIVSLGHSNCTAAVARQDIQAGAGCATHLFNAMSPLTSREPGLVGAVLDGAIPAGLIADGHHVAPEVMRIALAARQDGLFLVSDAMAVAGTDDAGCRIGDRPVHRNGGRLTLADGTLAGADMSLAQAVTVLVRSGIPRERALAMATSVPAEVVGLGHSLGRIEPGRSADLVLLGPDGELKQVWQAGRTLLAQTG